MKKALTSILKIIGFLLILPLIVASFIAFQSQVLSLPVNKEAWLLWGAGCYVILNLFVYDFKNVYVFGNSLIEKISTSLKTAGYFIPIYTILVIIAYVIAWILGRGGAWQPYFLFAIAFTLAMHAVLTAHEIYQSDESILKAHYLISFGAIVIILFFIMSLLLAWVVPEYSLVGFVKSLASRTAHYYKLFYKLIFVDS